MDNDVIESVLPENQLPKRLVVGCGALAHEIVALMNQNPRVQDATKLHCLPAKLHNTPQLIAQNVDEYLRDNAKEYDEIMIAYGDCGSAGELDRVCEKYSAQRLPGAHCYEFYAGTEVFEALLEEELGSFFLTDYLLKNFERLVIEGLGLDRHPELFDAYFKHYAKMVYLAQTEKAEMKEQARAYAERFGWDYEYRLVGINGMQAIANSPFVVGVASKEVATNEVASNEVATNEVATNEVATNEVATNESD